MSSRDALVVGGGIAGGALALYLTRAGRAVTVLEANAAPRHKVCGEFLSGEALHYIRELGVDVAALGGVPVTRVRLVTADGSAETALPFPARSLSRKALDEAVLQQAQAEGAQVLRGFAVVTLAKEAESWSASLSDGNAVKAQEAILATGKHDLRGWLRPTTPHHEMVAYKMLFRLSDQQHERLADAVELIVFPGGYAGLQPVEGGAANLSLVVRADTLRSTGAQWPAVMQHLQHASPHLRQRLCNAEELLPKPLTASGIRYGHLQRYAADGVWRLGDQAAVIPSFCGDGISIALHSAALAAQCLLRGESAQHYHQTLHRQLAARIHGAALLSRLLVAQPKVAQLAVTWPGLLRGISTLTRIPARHLLTMDVSAAEHV